MIYTSLSIRKTRVPLDPYPIDVSEVFCNDITGFCDSSTVGYGCGFAFTVRRVIAYMAVSHAGEARIGIGLRIHHDISSAQTPFIIRPTTLFSILLVPVRALSPEWSECWNSGSTARNVHFEPEHKKESVLRH